jgi:hypothetical protein
MEKLIDHNPTHAELVALFGGVPATLNSPFFDQDGEYGSIARLYLLRGDQAKHDEYMSKIENAKYRYDLLSHCSPPEST